MADAGSGTWDAIVIGSGMGGMAAAAALSKVGNKVLLLEQHDKLGGLTHSFSRDGFDWDVGVHYLSGLAPGQRERAMLDWLSETPVELMSVGAVYDTLHIADADPLPLSRPYAAQELDLKDRFPDDAKAIEAWTAALQAGRDALLKVTSTRAMPRLAGDVLRWWKSDEFAKWCGRTTTQVIDDITDNPDLAAALAGQWGTHGGRPGKASFAMHAMVAGSYLECGAWYPLGGSAAFADAIIPTITRAGGDARAGVRVDKLLFDGKAVTGVRAEDGTEYRSDVVISDIGARETVDRLLPDAADHADWVDDIRALPPSIAHFTLFLGFEGDIEDAGATRANHWLYPTGNVDAVWTDAPDGVPPGMFVSFASLKDPDHDPGARQAHMGEMLAWTDWSTVARWADTTAGARGDDYDAFKAQVGDTLFAQFARYFPEVAKLVVFREVSTPLTTVDFTGHRHGAFYGLDTTPARVMSDALQTRTPIDGLFLAGQDVVTPGVPGALWGGLLAAASVDRKVLKHLGG